MIRKRHLPPGSVPFEEPPRMSSERDACLRKADEARQRAAQATEPSTKSAYEKVAEYWMLLARLESFLAAKKITKMPSKRLSGCGAARQAHREHRTLARLARHGHVAAHHASELAGDGKAEPRAAEVLRC